MIEAIKEAAAIMLDELDYRFLEVMLVDAPRPAFQGHKIRVAINQNPPWYRDIFEFRYIKRKRVMRHLRRIAETGNIDSGVEYHEVLRGTIEHKARKLAEVLA